ncbi:HNH endonuclease domain-containing protein [Olivibacter domesticus]
MFSCSVSLIKYSRQFYDNDSCFLSQNKFSRHKFVANNISRQQANAISFSGNLYVRLIQNIGQYHMERFIPYSFVSHDQIWNLIPSNNSFNISKSNKPQA